MINRYISSTFLLLCLLVCGIARSQKKWTGTGQGGWLDMLNWQPAGSPEISDDVILDNSILAGDFVVEIPGQLVNIRSLTIAPSDGRKIELLLPSSNRLSPALILNSSDDAMIIWKGGIFRNSSGLASGQSLQVNGALCIYDEGRYVHNTRSAHATDLVGKLAIKEGRFRGVFEFDVPGGSYPLSFSNRVFGTLELSSRASGGSQTYNASGTNAVLINGDLQINEGVQFNLDLTKNLTINGNFLQQGGVFNLAAQSNDNQVIIRGQLYQASTGIITETAGGHPIITLAGDALQQVAVAGSIVNSVSVAIDNSSGMVLAMPLFLPYRLLLINGIIRSSVASLLTMGDSSSSTGGSVKSYIDGPVKKIGNSAFEFPVGKQGEYAPISIFRESGTGMDSFIADYLLANPQLAYGNGFDNPPVVRVSELEYWTLRRTAGSSKIRVSVSVRLFTHATALDKLVIMGWNSRLSRWLNEGNSAYTGISTGTLSSNILAGDEEVFTLGSLVSYQNPLPLRETAASMQSPAFTGGCRLTMNSSNPVNDYLNMVINCREAENIEAAIMDMPGRLLMVRRHSLHSGRNDLIVPVKDILPGVYLVGVYSKKGLCGLIHFTKR